MGRSDMPGVASVAGQGPAVLIVDDYPPNLTALQVALEPLGCRVVRAASGEEALRCLLQEDFAVIVLDVQMPGLSGFETAALIKERERSRHTPIIFLTAIHRDEGEIFKGYVHGAVDYLTKPLDPSLLRSKVAAFVDRTAPEGARRESFPLASSSVVWVLDDSPLEAEMTRRVIASRYRVEVYTDGPTMLERLAQGAGPDVLILDWQMPTMSGIEVCRFLRTTWSESALPILMLTAARADTPAVVEGIDAGANDYVTKPFAPAELLARVGSLLRIRQLHDRAQDAERALRAQRDRLQESNWISETLHRVALALSADLDLDATVRRLTDEAVALFHAEAGVFLTAPTVPGGRPAVRARSGVTGAFPDAALASAAGSLGEFCEVRASLRVDDVTRDARFAAASGADAIGNLRSLLAVPVALRSGELHGVLVVGHSATGAFTPQQERLLTSVAAQAAVALDNARLYAAARTTEVALRQKQAALEASEERFRLAVAASGVGIWDYNLLTGHIDWDARARELFDLPPEPAVDYDLFLTLVHADDRAGTDAGVRRALDPTSGGHYRGTYRLAAARDGAERWIEAEGRAFFNERGEAVRLTGTVLDVTARKRAEAEALAHAAFERQLIGIVSHDLRNPLNAILGSAAILLRADGLGEPHNRPLRRIVSSAERATRLIRDLLDFTQARLGRGIPVEPGAVDLALLGQQVVDEVRAAHPGRDVVFDHRGEGRGVWDADRLAQVITNLLANALSYSPPESRVRLGARGDAEEVTLEVHNEGPPIAPTALARLFEPLERGEAEPGRAARSIGLGLYIVDQIVRAHGGRVEVRSNESDGTTFVVRLPRLARA